MYLRAVISAEREAKLATDPDLCRGLSTSPYLRCLLALAFSLKSIDAARLPDQAVERDMHSHLSSVGPWKSWSMVRQSSKLDVLVFNITKKNLFTETFSHTNIDYIYSEYF